MAFVQELRQAIVGEASSACMRTHPCPTQRLLFASNRDVPGSPPALERSRWFSSIARSRYTARCMRILVTGGAGFIGSHVCEHARAAGHSVLAFDDLSSGRRQNVPEGVELVVGDIRDQAALNAVMRTFAPQAVSHQAAQASVAVSVRDPLHDANVNVMGSLNVLRACVEHGAARVVFASTGGAIYGDIPEGQRANVDWPAKPESPYAASKLAVEGYLRFFISQGLMPTVLRYANVYGPRQDPHGEAGVVAIFTRRLLAGQTCQVNAKAQQGDRGCVRDYVFVADVAQANLAALEGNVHAPIVNVGTGVGTDTQTLLLALAEHADVTPDIVFTPHREGDVAHSVLAVEPFLQLCPKPVALYDGLRTTVASMTE